MSPASRSRGSRSTSAAAWATTPSWPARPAQLRVTADDLPDYVERLGRRYLEQRTDADESFAAWARRADEEALR